MSTQSWILADADTPKKFDSLVRGDFAQLRFVTDGVSPVTECLWVKVIDPTNNCDEYWAVIDDKPELITDMPLDYQPIFKSCHVVDFVAQDRDGIAVVDLWGTDWGWYKRTDESDFPIQCSLTTLRASRRLRVLGDGCYRGNTAIRQFNKSISYKNKKRETQKFDEAWKSISEHSQRILFVYYVINDKATLLEKVAALGITVHEYFPTLRAAREEIWSALKRAE